MESPITKSALNVSIDETLDVKKIIEVYSRDYNIDVSRFFNSESIDVYQCEDTGLRFFHPRSLAGDEQFYIDLFEGQKVDYYSKWKWENDVAVEYISKDAKVLDVGCGAGRFLDELKKRGIFCEGIEFNDSAIRECKRKLHSVTKTNIESMKISHADFYDVVCSFQVLEHIGEVHSFISAQLTVTRPGGLMIFGVPHNNPYLYKNDKYHTLNLPPHHMGLWSKEAFSSLEKNFNVELINIHIEPQDNLRYWFEVQLKSLYPNRIDAVEKVLGHFLVRAVIRVLRRPLSNIVEGRNMVAVFKKM